MKGHIRQRSKGSWSIVIDVGRDAETGKRCQHWHTVKGTKRDAEKRLTELLHSLNRGSYVKPTRLTVAEYLEQWLDGYVATNTAPRTRERYEEIVRLHLIPALGSLLLLALHPQHIQKYYATALESGRRDGKGGLSARTVHKHHRVLYEALKHGVRQGIIVRNVAEAVDPPRPQSKEISMVGPGHVRLLLDAAKPTPYYVAFFTAVYTGLRRGELLGLRWCDIDLDLATLSVIQALQQLRGGQYIFREPKSRRGRRQIALSPSLAILFREHRTKQENDRRLLCRPLVPTDLVFSHPDGRPLRPTSVTRAFRTFRLTRQRSGFVSKMFAILPLWQVFVYNLKPGEVSEWFKEPLSKSGVPKWDRGFESHPLRGEVLEWPIRRAWRARRGKPLVGSNPTLSAFFRSSGHL